MECMSFWLAVKKEAYDSHNDTLTHIPTPHTHTHAYTRTCLSRVGYGPVDGEPELENFILQGL